MAREGTKAHQLSLASGEIPMASVAAISCIAQALRTLADEPPPTPPADAAAAAAAAARPLDRGLQFAVAEIEWWRSPWPDHPLLDGFMRRLPPPAADAADAEGAPVDAAAAAAAAGEGSGSDAGEGSSSGSEDARARVEAFVQARLSAWEPAQTLVELGLDSLDLVQLRNNFQKAFACKVPLGVFTNATQTLESLLVKLSEKV